MSLKSLKILATILELPLQQVYFSTLLATQTASLPYLIIWSIKKLIYWLKCTKTLISIKIIKNNQLKFL